MAGILTVGEAMTRDVRVVREDTNMDLAIEEPKLAKLFEDLLKYRPKR